jgi:hypothetical protein
MSARYALLGQLPNLADERVEHEAAAWRELERAVADGYQIALTSNSI